MYRSSQSQKSSKVIVSRGNGISTAPNFNTKVSLSQAWWHTPLIPALRRLKQKDHKFEASLGYIARPSLKKKKKVSFEAGTVGHICNFTYAESRDKEDHSSKPTQANSL
jgi:hypothetical protein